MSERREGKHRLVYDKTKRTIVEVPSRPDPDELKRLIGELETAHECCEGRAARMAARAALYKALGVE